jgi:hypothetical protein
MVQDGDHLCAQRPQYQRVAGCERWRIRAVLCSYAEVALSECDRRKPADLF